MKQFKLISLLASSLFFATVTQAHTNDHRHTAGPGPKFMHQLRELSLSSTQHQQIRALVRDFRSQYQVAHQDGRKAWLADLMVDSDADIGIQVESRFRDRQAQAFAVASLRHAIYSLLSDTQRQALAERDKRDPIHTAPRRSHDTMFSKLDLKPEQRTQMAALQEKRDELMQDFRSEMAAFRDAEGALISSDTFSYERWLTALEPHRIRLLELAQARAANQRAMFSVLNAHQQQVFLTLIETRPVRQSRHRTPG